jgi:hypothetical protein
LNNHQNILNESQDSRIYGISEETTHGEVTLNAKEWEMKEDDQGSRCRKLKFE